MLAKLGRCIWCRPFAVRSNDKKSWTISNIHTWVIYISTKKSNWSALRLLSINYGKVTDLFTSRTVIIFSSQTYAIFLCTIWRNHLIFYRIVITHSIRKSNSSDKAFHSYFLASMTFLPICQFSKTGYIWWTSYSI